MKQHTKNIIFLIWVTLAGGLFGFIWNKYVMLDLMVWALANPSLWLVIISIACGLLTLGITLFLYHLQWSQFDQPLRTVSRW